METGHRKDAKGQGSEATLKQTHTQSQQQGTSSPEKKRQRSKPHTEVILRTAAEMTFADVLGQIRSKVNPIGSRAQVKALRKEQPSDVLEELRRS